MHDPGERPPARRSTPRPSYDAPTILRRDEVAHHVWGDLGSGLVTDRVYASTRALHVLEFELAPGGEFRHSATNKTVFAADVAYCVLEGELILADPEHGEVRTVPAGQTVFFRRDTWHHGFNPGAGVVRVLEFFAPPPSRGTASEYAVRQDDLAGWRYAAVGPPDADGPPRAARSDAATRLRVLGSNDAVWSFAASAASHLVGVLVNTEFLQISIGRVFPGNVEDFRANAHESLLRVTSGELWVDCRGLTTDQACVGRLTAGDALFLPGGSRSRVLVRSGEEARYLLGSGRMAPDGWTP
jgi:quercetin dioxygenase-like cupin family protein